MTRLCVLCDLNDIKQKLPVEKRPEGNTPKVLVLGVFGEWMELGMLLSPLPRRRIMYFFYNWESS